MKSSINLVRLLLLSRSTPDAALRKTCAGSILLAIFCFVLTGFAQASPSPHFSQKTTAQAEPVRTPESYLSGAALKEFQSLEPVDTHTHIFQSSPAFLKMLERLHMHVLDIMVVNDTSWYQKDTEPQKQYILDFVHSSNYHAAWCTSFSPYKFNDSDFAQKAIAELNRDFANGAIAVKIWKNVGMEVKNNAGQYVMPDDPRLEPIYKDIAAHNKTLIAHLAEPDDAWQPLSSKGLYSSYYHSEPEWNMTTHPGAPSKQAIIRARDHMLVMNPNLRVVGAHLASLEGDVDQVAARFDLDPNFVVDTAARVQSLATQPRAKVRAFILKYQDRILYGTDLHLRPKEDPQKLIPQWEKHYAVDWRFFATDDTFEYMGHKTKGLNLPRTVLKKIYHDNAVRWIPGVIGSADAHQ